MEYSIDTSALIEGWIRDFPPDTFPNAWKNIEELINDGVLAATEEVMFEIKKKHDTLYDWSLLHKNMFIQIDNKIQETVRDILREYKKLVDTRMNRSGADPFVIALALINNLSVVTAERPSGSLERPKIPDVCNALNVRWLNMIDLFRERGWKF